MCLLIFKMALLQLLQENKIMFNFLEDKKQNT